MKLPILLSSVSTLSWASALPRLENTVVNYGNSHLHRLRQEATGLNAAIQQKGKYFGTFSDGKYLDDAPYTEILGDTARFGIITPGNSMKWDTTEVCMTPHAHIGDHGSSPFYTVCV
jgi:hypothetical protein